MSEDRQRDALEEIRCNTIESNDIDLVIKKNRKNAQATKSAFKLDLGDGSAMSKET